MSQKLSIRVRKDLAYAAMKVVPVRIPYDLLEVARSEAKKLGTSTSAVIRAAIALGLEAEKKK